MAPEYFKSRRRCEAIALGESRLLHLRFSVNQLAAAVFRRHCLQQAVPVKELVAAPVLGQARSPELLALVALQAFVRGSCDCAAACSGSFSRARACVPVAASSSRTCGRACRMKCSM